MTLAGNRPHTPKQAGERETLTGFLDHYRATLALKCEGLTPEQLAERAVPPSSLSLLGLVRHMGEVEKGWFRAFAGEPTEWRYSTDDDPDGDFDGTVGTQECVDDAFAYWQGEVGHAREIVAGARDLDETLYRERSDTTHSLRWILVHMIEEYARHCGHADLLRERIDGVTGD
ncbi:MAG: DinB family protein [Jatrophihabitans sp.]|nr:MAG: DinB family protein [Jatrophihabitans sp.]